MDAETLIATVTHLFIHKGAAREVAILATATTELVQTDFDNWNGGTYGYTFFLRVPLELYVQISDVKESCEESINDVACRLFSDNQFLKRTVIDPTPASDPNWRDKARLWL